MASKNNKPIPFRKMSTASPLSASAPSVRIPDDGVDNSVAWSKVDWASFGTAVYEELQAQGEENSCILAARVLLDVLPKMGFQGVQELSVRPNITNPPASDWTTRIKHMPSTKAEEAEWDALGCVAAKVGEHAPKGQWAGHVIVSIPNIGEGKHGWIDVTIPQVNRPDKGFILMPIAGRVDSTHITSGKGFMSNNNGNRVVYLINGGDSSYKRTKNWTNPSFRTPIVAGILQRLGL